MSYHFLRNQSLINILKLQQHTENIYLYKWTNLINSMLLLLMDYNVTESDCMCILGLSGFYEEPYLKT